MEENLKIPAHVALILDGNGRWAKNGAFPGSWAIKRAAKLWNRL